MDGQYLISLLVLNVFFCLFICLFVSNWEVAFSCWWCPGFVHCAGLFTWVWNWQETCRNFDHLNTFWLMGDEVYDLLWWWIANAEWCRKIQFHESFLLWKTGQKAKEIQRINRLICHYRRHEFKSRCPRGVNWGNNKSFVHRSYFITVWKRWILINIKFWDTS